MIKALWGFCRFLSGAEHRERLAYYASDEYRQECERRVKRECERCDICSGRKKFRCAICYQPISTHSHEGDFACEEHGLVAAISEDRMRDQLKALDEMRTGA